MRNRTYSCRFQLWIYFYIAVLLCLFYVFELLLAIQLKNGLFLSSSPSFCLRKKMKWNEKQRKWDAVLCVRKSKMWIQNWFSIIEWRKKRNFQEKVEEKGERVGDGDGGGSTKLFALIDVLFALSVLITLQLLKCVQYTVNIAQSIGPPTWFGWSWRWDGLFYICNNFHFMPLMNGEKLLGFSTKTNTIHKYCTLTLYIVSSTHLCILHVETLSPYGTDT